MTTRVRIKTKSGEVLCEGYHEGMWATGWVMINGKGFDQLDLEKLNLIIEPIEEPKPKKARAFRSFGGEIKHYITQNVTEFHDDDGKLWTYAPEYDIEPRGGEK